MKDILTKVALLVAVVASTVLPGCHAFHKPVGATMSSQFVDPGNYKPELCINNVMKGFHTGTDGKRYQEMCHTAGSDANPWLQIDYGKEVSIKEVRIFNRCCSSPGDNNCNNRLFYGGNCGSSTFANCQKGSPNCGFQVRIGNNRCSGTNDNCNTNPVCYTGDKSDDQDPLDTSSSDTNNMVKAPCNSVMKGRYVQVILPGNQRILNLHEVIGCNYGQCGLEAPKTTTTVTTTTTTVTTTTTATTTTMTTKTTITDTLQQQVGREIGDANNAQDGQSDHDILVAVAGLLGDTVDEVNEMKSKISTLESAMIDVQSENQELRGLLEKSSMMLTAAISDLEKDAQKNITKVSQQINAVIDTFSSMADVNMKLETDALDDCGDDCEVSVSTDAYNADVRAPLGTVNIRTAQCGSFDMCELRDAIINVIKTAKSVGDDNQ